MRISFTVNGSPRSLAAPPLRRLLDILREDLGLTGSKEGCGEGECGACAVIMNGILVNSCLVPALQLHGAQITTIEGLGAKGALDPIESAFLDEGAVQCGFCIPGMVMATRSLLDRNPHPSREEIREGLSGNLCRCTGYERIIRAVERATGAAQPEVAARSAAAMAAQPATADAPPSNSAIEFACSPTSLDEAVALLQEHGDSVRIIAGATDLLTSVKLGLDRPRALLDISGIAALRAISRENGQIEIGATATLTEIATNALIARHLPALARAARLFGAAAIQNRATLGGNLMSASPAADSPPALAALDAAAVLQSAAGVREVPVRVFFTGYRKTDRRAGEILTKIRIPVPPDDARQAFYKIGTRRAQSIAKVSLACCARLDSQGSWRETRIAAGSVAPTPLPLTRTEAFLEGRTPSRHVIAEAIAIAEGEIRPIDDLRSTEIYRRTIAGRLLGRFLAEFLGGVPEGSSNGPSGGCAEGPSDGQSEGHSGGDSGSLPA